MRASTAFYVAIFSTLTCIAVPAVAQDSSDFSAKRTCGSLQNAVMEGLDPKTWSFDSTREHDVSWAEVNRIRFDGESSPTNARRVSTRLEARLFYDALGRQTGCAKRFLESNQEPPVRLRLEVSASGRVSRFETPERGMRAKLARCLSENFRRMPAVGTSYSAQLDVRAFEFVCAIEPTPVGRGQGVAGARSAHADLPRTRSELRKLDYVGEWNARTLSVGYEPFDVDFRLFADTSEKVAWLDVTVTSNMESLKCRSVRLFVDDEELPHAGRLEKWGGERELVRAAFVGHAFPKIDALELAHLEACGQRVDLALGPLRAIFDKLEKLEEGELEPNTH